MADPKKLTTWLRNKLYSERRDKAVADRLILRHAAEKSSQLRNWDVPQPPNQTPEDWVTDTVEQIFAEAESYAANMGGVQRFRVAVRLDNDEEETTLFRCGTPDEDAFDSEPPNARGQLSQTLRHNEALFRMVLRTNQHMIASLERQNARKDELIEKLVKDKFESIETVEALIQRKHERELETRTNEVKVKALEKGADKLMAMISLVGAGLGNKFLPASKSSGVAEPGLQLSPQLTVVLDTFLESVDPELFGVLIQKATPEQVAMLQTLYKDYQQRRAARLDGEKKPEDAKTNGNGAAQETH